MVGVAYHGRSLESRKEPHCTFRWVACEASHEPLVDATREDVHAVKSEPGR